MSHVHGPACALLFVGIYVAMCLALAIGALYLIARDAKPLDEDVDGERSRGDIL